MSFLGRKKTLKETIVASVFHTSRSRKCHEWKIDRVKKDSMELLLKISTCFAILSLFLCSVFDTISCKEVFMAAAATYSPTRPMIRITDVGQFLHISFIVEGSTTTYRCSHDFESCLVKQLEQHPKVVQ